MSPLAQMTRFGGGKTFERFTISNKDSECLSSRKDSGLVISRTFGLPPSAIGITDNATYPNKGEEGRALTAHGAGPQAEVSHSTGS